MIFGNGFPDETLQLNIIVAAIELSNELIGVSIMGGVVTITRNDCRIKNKH